MISNLEYYRVFYCAAAEGSFTKAAGKLYVTQSAVSQTISHLEDELGCRLLNRTSKGLTLTEEGYILYGSLQNAFAKISQAEIDMKKHQTTSASLKIGTSLIALHTFLQPVLLQYQKIHSDIRLILHESTVHNLTYMLETGEISMAFLVTPLEYGTRLKLTELSTVQDIACASPRFPVNFERIYTPKQLLDFPIISSDSENGIRTTVDEWFWDSGIIFSPTITARSGAEICELTEKAFGIGILPKEDVMQNLKDGTIKQVRTTSLPQKRTIYLAIRPNQILDEKEKELLAMVKQYLTGCADL